MKYTSPMPNTIVVTRERALEGYTALMDWSSFSKLTDNASILLLRQRIVAPGDPMRIREAIGPFLTDIIARLVVYDGFLLDTAVNETYANPLSSEAARIAQVRFDPEIYRTAVDSTLQFVQAMRNTDVERQGLLNLDRFFSSDLKNYADQLSRGSNGLGGMIGDSGQTVPRAVFYLELSRQLGLQLFLSYEKRDLLKDLDRLIWQDAFSVLSKAVDSQVMKGQIEGLENSDLRIHTPAVVDLVIRRAFDRRISLEESIIQVRNIEGAQQFRDLLSKMQRLLMLGDKASLLKIQKLMSPLLKAANTWSATADPEVRWLWQARVSKLPKIGAFLEALGVEVPALPIKSRFNSYVQFVSEWYKTSTDDIR